MLMKSLILTLISCLSFSAMAVEGPLGKYVTDEEITQITNRIVRRAEVRGMALRLDMRNGIQCGRIRNAIRRNNLRVSKFALDDLCNAPRDGHSPYKDLVIFQTEENTPLLNYLISGFNIGMTAYQSQATEQQKDAQLEAAAKSDSFLLSPLFAAFLSESVTHLRTHILENRGRLGESKVLGSSILVITNPAESIANIFNRIAKYRAIKSAKSQFLLKDYSSELQTFGPNRRGQAPDLNALEFKMEFLYN